MDPNDLVRTALTEVKGNFRDYKYPNNYILDKTVKIEKSRETQVIYK